MVFFYFSDFVGSSSSHQQNVLNEEVPEFVKGWNKAKKKVFKPKTQIKRNIKKRKTSTGPEPTKSSRSKRFGSESENE